MTPNLLAALAAFVFAASVTPGPNNVMLMASGANFGVRRTIPHGLGVTLGISAMVALVGLGAMRVFDAWPPIYTVLKVLSALFLLYLAWKIATAAPQPTDATPTRGHPLTLLQAAAFQWVNPKAWAVALTAITVYAPERSLAGILVVALVFGLVSLPSISIWVIVGSRLRGWLSDPTRLRVFNIAMAAVLVASMVPALL